MCFPWTRVFLAVYIVRAAHGFAMPSTRLASYSPARVQADPDVAESVWLFVSLLRNASTTPSSRLESHRPSSADTLHEAVVSHPPASDGLIIGVPGRLRNAGQQSLHQRVDEREKSLLSELGATDIAGQTLQDLRVCFKGNRGASFCRFSSLRIASACLSTSARKRSTSPFTSTSKFYPLAALSLPDFRRILSRKRGSRI
jgi:hypothetical protein